MLYVSSQIGCKMGCTFCATGTLGLIGNLKAAEILEQIAHSKINVEKDIRNIVFMGMFILIFFFEFSTENVE